VAADPSAARSAQAAEGEAMPADAVEVGRVAGAWGVKGWIRVVPHADDPQALFSSRRWYVQPPEPPTLGPRRGWPALLRVSQVRAHADGIVAGIHDLDDRDEAESLRGARLFVARSSFPTAGEGEFYWVDLIGLAVRNRQGEDLGTVAGLLDTGVHSVLRVAPAEGPERLIPFVDAYVDHVDLAGRCIHVDWGLDY
jgi:16S rRNA processing protein RimM